MRVRNSSIVVALVAVVAAACASKTADDPKIAGDPNSTHVENISRVALDAARVELEARVASERIVGGAHMVVPTRLSCRC